MPSDKRTSIAAKVPGDVVSSLDVPFGIPQYVKCMHHGLTFVLLCVPFLPKVSIRSSTDVVSL